MNKFVLVIIGAGSAPQSHLEAAVERLCAEGHEVGHACLIEGNQLTPYIGTAQDLKNLEGLQLNVLPSNLDAKLEEILHILKADKQPAEAPKTRGRGKGAVAAEKKEGGAVGAEAGGQQQQGQSPAENLGSEGQTQEGGAGETGSQESAPEEKQAEDSAGDEGQESQTGDPQQEESAA